VLVLEPQILQLVPLAGALRVSVQPLQTAVQFLLERPVLPQLPPHSTEVYPQILVPQDRLVLVTVQLVTQLVVPALTFPHEFVLMQFKFLLVRLTQLPPHEAYVY
jgi:hypothetical protein